MYPLHIWTILPLGNWNLRIADETIKTAKIAQCASQDIVLNMFRGDFAEKNMVPPGITQANTVHMLLIFRATSIFLRMRIFTCSNLQKTDTEQILPRNPKFPRNHGNILMLRTVTEIAVGSAHGYTPKIRTAHYTPKSCRPSRGIL